MNTAFLVCAKSVKILFGDNIMSSFVSWKTMLEQHMKAKGESFDDLVKMTLSEDELNTPFDNCYGLSNGMAFFAWTNNRVYFAVDYDGLEYVSSVPRNPTLDEIPYHIGG